MAEEAPLPADFAVDSTPDCPEVIRMQRALARMISGEGAAEFLAGDFLPTFQRELPRRLGELKRHIAARAAAGVQHEAHTIKGMLRDMGEQEASAIAYKLEVRAERKELDETATIFAELERMAQRVLGHVRAVQAKLLAQRSH